MLPQFLCITPSIFITNKVIENASTEQLDELATNMKRRVDAEHRERITYLREHEESVSKKQEEVEKKEQALLKREIDVASKEKEYQQIKKLQEEVDNQKASLAYLKQHLGN